MLCEDPNRRLKVTREAVSAGASVVTVKASR